VNPFEALGLLARRQLTDAKVRSLWRRIAVATHPDRADDRDPAAAAAAAAACTGPRTTTDQEALADLRGLAGGRVPDCPVPGRKNSPARLLLAVPPLIRYGRPVRLAFRLLAVVATGALAVLGAGWEPASLAVMTGALTWLLCTGRSDLARDRRS